MIINRKVVGGGGGSNDITITFLQNTSYNGGLRSANIDTDQLNILMPNATSVGSSSVREITGAKRIKLTLPEISVDCSYMFYGCKDMEELILDCSTRLWYNWGSFTQRCNSLKTITGAIDFSSQTNSPNAYVLSETVQDVTFAPNTISVSVYFYFPNNLTDSSLVSIANGLNGSVSGKSLQLSSSRKARCSTLMGTVTDGVFTAYASGSVTLADFITNTKGWTLS